MTFPATPLPTRVELDVGGTPTDITAYVYQRDGIRITAGRADEAAEINPSTCTLTLNNRDGRFSPRNPTGPYYGLIGRNSQLRVQITETEGWLQVNQATGTTIGSATIATADKAALDITGDIDLRFEANLDSWRDSMELISKWSIAGNQRAYQLLLAATGKLFILHSTDGTAAGVLSVGSTIPVPRLSGRMAVRATLDVSNAGNRVREFFISDSIAGPWEQLGDTITTAGTTSIFSSSGSLRLLDNPSNDTSGSVIRGRVYKAEVLNGIAGTAVANPDFTIQSEAAASFVDAAGNTWTPAGDVSLTHRDTRFVGEVTAWPQKWDVTGRDIYTPIVASDVLRRLVQGSSSLGSAMRRGITRDPDVVAYWSMEDGEDARFFGTAISGAPGITKSTTTVLASDSDFACSDSIPLIGQRPLKAITPSYPSTGQIVVQFLLHIPTAGLTAATSTIASVTTNGTAARWDIIYGTGSGGTLSLRALDSAGATLATYGPSAFLMDGSPCMLKLRLTNTGADVESVLVKYTVGSTTLGALTNTLAGNQVGRVTIVTLNPQSVADYDQVSAGHLAVTNATDSFWDEVSQVNAFAGETVTDRVIRLCQEESVAFCPIGPRGATDSQLMGPQLPDTLINLLRQCADADLGVLYAGRQYLELRYRPGKAMYSQRSALTLDYSSHQMNDLEPMEDDQTTRNDVTASRINGGSGRAQLTTGPLSVNEPPDGVGRYDTVVSLNVFTDSTLANQASFRMHLGTVDEARYPRLSLSAESSHLTSVLEPLRRLELGDRITITTPPEWLDQQDIVQLVQGYTETLNVYEHGYELTLTPGKPWDIGVYDDHYGEDRYGNGDCVTTEALDTTETGVDVLTGSIGQPWSTVDVPYDVIIGGEIMTVTAVTGATNTQTLTVTRSINGVVKSHVSGVSVELTPLSYYGL